MTSELSPHVLLPEPMLSFHPDRSSDRDSHPLRGLRKYGPYSAGLLPDPIRVGTIAPHGEGRRLYDFLKELKETAKPTERKDYLPDWPGFHSVFGVHLAPAEQSLLELGEDLEARLTSSPAPHVVLADHLVRAIQSMVAHRDRFDMLFIYLPQRWHAAFKGGDGDEFDLHDHLKAFTARQGIPIQVVREDRALAYPDRASVMWRIGLALYAKAGGVPWKLADADPETAYIGLSYAVRPPGSPQSRFVTCCSQVFDAEGAGLEFVAYDTTEANVQRDNPFLSRTEMFRIMSRAMDLYRRRHAGQAPRRVMVHKSTEFKRDEVDGCMEALELSESVDLIQVVSGVSWQAARLEKARNGKKGESTMFPVKRGTLLNIAERDAMLWVHGDVSGISDRGSYFQGAKGTPRPIRLVRHAGHGTWDDTARAILGLSKMNWNNDALYDPEPVTLGYASVLARVVKRMDLLGSAPYQFRFFM